MKITPAELALTVAKLDKINARAAKRGWTGRVTLEATPTTITRTVGGITIDGVNLGGLTIEEEAFEVELGGDAPSYNGWSFLATLDWDEHAGLVTRCAPGVEVVVERDSLVAGWCDHCKTTRTRKATYLVRNEETGVQLQVGSSCIKDFLGWTGSVCFIYDEDVRDDVEGGWGGGGEKSFSVESILAVSWAAIKAYGWVPASSYDKQPTKSVVRRFLDPSNRRDKMGRGVDQDIIDEVGKFVEGCADAGVKVREFILSDDFAGSSEYVTNLKAVATPEFATGSSLGLLASAPQALARFEEKSLIVKAAKATPSTHFGAVGDKGVLFTGTIEGVRYIQGDYGTTVLYSLRNADTGQIAKWFASREALGDDTQVGTTVTLKATIKAHEEYNGTLSTVLTRCKAV